jgi:hypothetical protein
MALTENEVDYAKSIFQKQNAVHMPVVLVDSLQVSLAA